MGSAMQSTFSKDRTTYVAAKSNSFSETLGSSRVRVDQALETLDVIAQQLNDIAQVSSAVTAEETFFVSCPDGRRKYSAKPSSNTLVGYQLDPGTGREEEFCRVRLGLQTGGISAVAVGGMWVFAACGPANRVVVLRLCHDWYQNRTRLLVMRVVDGGSSPSKIVASRHGTVVGVFYSGESLVRVYYCFPNGKLELQKQFAVPSDTEHLAFDEHNMTLVASGPISDGFGTTVLELESIFKEIPDLDMVRR